MQEKKNTPKIIVCVCVCVREREGGRNNFSVMENYAKNWRENNKFIEEVWIWRDKIKENEWKDEEWY